MEDRGEGVTEDFGAAQRGEPSSFEVLTSKLKEKIQKKSRQVKQLEATLAAKQANLDEIRESVRAQQAALEEAQKNHEVERTVRLAFEAEREPFLAETRPRICIPHSELAQPKGHRAGRINKGGEKKE